MVSNSWFIWSILVEFILTFVFILVIVAVTGKKEVLL